MIECGKCGTENHFDGAKFCKHCGAELLASVAVAVAEEQATKAQSSQTPVTQQDMNTEQRDSDFEVTDLPTDETDAKARIGVDPSGAGFDQLLKRYETTPSPQEIADSAPEVSQPISSDLGIESPSDYLMSQVEKPAPEQVAQVVVPIKVPLATPLQSEITQVPSDSLKPAPKQSISADDRDRLITSLRKSLNDEEVAPKREATSQFKEPVQQASSFSPPPVLPKIEPETSEPQTGARHATAPIPLTVFVRGHNLTFPERVRLVSGESVVYGNQHYMIKKGALDRKILIAGGAIGLIMLTMLLIILFGGSSAPKPMLFGVVTDAQTKQVLAGISVSIPQTGASTITDEDGTFKFANLANGRYDIKMEGIQYEPFMIPTSISNDESKVMAASLIPIVSQRGTFSETIPQPTDANVANLGPIYSGLKIKCSVTDAMVIVDGKTLGSVGQTFRKVLPGTHTVEVRRDGYEIWSQEVKLDEDQTTTLTVILSEAKPEKPTEYSANEFFQQAEALLGEDKYTEAIGYYTLALAKDNTMVQAYLRRAEANLASGKSLNARADYRSAADVYLHMNQFASAVSCYDKIIEMSPNAADAYQLRGWAQISAGNYDAGLKDLSKALSFNKDDTQSLFEYGKALYITGNYKDAEKTLKKIRKFGDDSPEIYGYLALAYLSQGNDSDARKNYEAFSKRASSAQTARMTTESGWQRLTAMAGK